MTDHIPGIHHITAMVNDAQQNIDFYTEVLGLRMIKLTVNFDDPGTYHLYFGDEQGRPGTLLTFFPWEDLRPGTSGAGQASAVALAIPPTALDYWTERLASYAIRAGNPMPRFQQQVIPFSDPAGLLLELVTQPDTADYPGWAGGPVAAEHAIRTIAGVTLTVNQQRPSAALLTDVFGFTYAAAEEHRHRYLAGDGRTTVDLLQRPDLPYGMMGAGSVHHIAWRTASDEQQLAWQRLLSSWGLRVTPVQERQYFRSIYFREPGGVLFEIATDQPGFAIDEPLEQLGTRLMLPPWFEGQRATIERRLPPLSLPTLAQED